MNRYVDDKFQEKYSATIAVDSAKCSQYIGKDRIDVFIYKKYIYIYKNKINFWDFSGHPEFLDVRNEFYREAHMLLLVFDLTSKRSFESLDMWVREASDQGASEIPIAIIGNKVIQDKK